MPTFKSIRSPADRTALTSRYPYVLLCFTGTPCDVCPSEMALRKIEATYPKGWGLATVDVDDARTAQLLAEYFIDGVPTFVLIRREPDPKERWFIDIPDEDAKNVLEWLERESRSGGGNSAGVGRVVEMPTICGCTETKKEPAGREVTAG